MFVIDDTFGNGDSFKEMKRRAENCVNANISRGNYWIFSHEDGSVLFVKDELIAISNGIPAERLLNLNKKEQRDKAVELILESMRNGFVY